MFTFDQQNEEREDGGNFDDVNIETDLISTAPRWSGGEEERWGVRLLSFNLGLTGYCRVPDELSSARCEG